MLEGLLPPSPPLFLPLLLPSQQDFGGFWRILKDFGGFWRILGDFHRFWGNSKDLKKFWGFYEIFNDFRGNFKDFGRFPEVCDDFAWFSMILGKFPGFWWIPEICKRFSAIFNYFERFPMNFKDLRLPTCWQGSRRVGKVICTELDHEMLRCLSQRHEQQLIWSIWCGQHPYAADKSLQFQITQISHQDIL